MKDTRPKVYLLGFTRFSYEPFQGFIDYLDDIKAEWKPEEETSDGESLVEMAGRMCYRSWQPYDESRPDSSNPNVTRIREGNQQYLKNILESGHGSILEHVNITFLFRDVSRVFTHELVRHRAGCAYSQESLRYVRLNELKFWMPDEIYKNIEARELFIQTIEQLESAQSKLAEIFSINDGKNFSEKKALTSAFRRIAPIGLATSIMMTANIRTLRHVIAMRTAISAEAEIRLVFDSVARICHEKYPNFFQDMDRNKDGEWKFKNEKI